MRKSRLHLLAFASLAALSACASVGGRAPSQVDTDSLVYGDYLTGRYAEMVNDSGAAAARYANALKLAPNDPILLEGAIESALIAGDIDRAVAAANAAKARGADLSVERLTLGAVALKSGRYGQARELTQVETGHLFDRQAARIMRAWALAGDGKIDLGVEALNGASDAAPFARVFDYQRAMMLQRVGRTREAEAAYESAMKTGLRIAPAILQHGALLERMGQTDKAASLYRAVLVGGHEPAIEAAQARLARGEPPPPAATPAQATAIGLYALSALLIGQSSPDFYLPYLTLALGLEPGLDHARLMFADGVSETNQYAAARAQLERIAPNSPLYERAQVGLSALLRAEENEDGALAAAREAFAKTNGRAARLALADILRGMDRWAEAEPHYSALIATMESADEGWRLYFARGAVRERLGRWPEAEADLKKALELAPLQPEVLNYLGYSWIDQGLNLREGLRMIERAATLQPDAGYIIDSLGWAHFRLGEYDKAIEYLEKAIELTPEDATLNDHLGDAYWRVSRKVEARFQWSRALTLQPSEAEAVKIKTKLANGLPAAPAKQSANAGPGQPR